MDQKVDKKIDELTKKLMQDYSFDSPAIDFTTQVMSKVERFADSRTTTYEPLISKELWLLLILGVFSACTYFIYGQNQLENSWFSSIDFEPLKNGFLFDLPYFEISTVGIYAITGFTFFVSIQILMLKNHFNKRLA